MQCGDMSKHASCDPCGHALLLIRNDPIELQFQSAVWPHPLKLKEHCVVFERILID